MLKLQLLAQTICGASLTGRFYKVTSG